MNSKLENFLNNPNLQKYVQQGKSIYDTSNKTLQGANEYTGDINKVNDLATQEGNLMNAVGQRGMTSGTFDFGKKFEELATPEEVAQFQALKQQRQDLVNKQSLGALNSQVATYIPTNFFNNATDAANNANLYGQGITTGLANAAADVARETPIMQKYTGTSIGDKLKALLAQAPKTDQYGNTVS